MNKTGFQTRCVHSGDHIVCLGDVYGSTFDLLGSNLPELGVTTTFLDGSQISLLGERIKYGGSGA